jgi:hypothetical protein
MTNAHTFHIPVMGIGYTVDTPVKIAQYGINSVISLVDDHLLERLRQYYCEMYHYEYSPITTHTLDSRSLRITAYLNLIDKIVKNQMDELFSNIGKENSEFEKYINLLPDTSPLKIEYLEKIKTTNDVGLITEWAKKNLRAGSLDVNIMTKVDKDNFVDGHKLSMEFNDAHSALRGFANSTLDASVVFSAGLSPTLYSYLENFPDFFPDKNSHIKKRITLKVSDYRSALIQGKFLAKKGLWVSEYRIESGLNCGGHVFPTEGHLTGPILAEYKEKRSELINAVFELYSKALTTKNFGTPEKMPFVTITAQGGVGTHAEHQLLREYYNIDSVGWGTPFLLVPEAVSVDSETLQLLADSKRDDIYISNISPLDIKFSNLRQNTRDQEKRRRIESGHPGFPCTRQLLKVHTDPNNRAWCKASAKYQRIMLQELEEKNLPEIEKAKEREKITEKSCICVGLGNSTLVSYGILPAKENTVTIWFNKTYSLSEMLSHIYGKTNILNPEEERPHMFIEELKLYIEDLKSKIDENFANSKFMKQLEVYSNNLQKGIEYYRNVLPELTEKYIGNSEFFMSMLNNLDKELSYITIPSK